MIASFCAAVRTGIAPIPPKTTAEVHSGRPRSSAWPFPHPGATGCGRPSVWPKGRGAAAPLGGAISFRHSCMSADPSRACVLTRALWSKPEQIPIDRSTGRPVQQRLPRPNRQLTWTRTQGCGRAIDGGNGNGARCRQPDQRPKFLAAKPSALHMLAAARLRLTAASGRRTPTSAVALAHGRVGRSRRKGGRVQLALVPWPISKLAIVSRARTSAEWSHADPPRAAQLLKSSCAVAVFGKLTPS